MNTYTAAPDRYTKMPYAQCGRRGLKLPRVSLGLWHNFGGIDSVDNQRAMLRRAFDLGITHFDLANNYGPPPGSAEENFGRLFREDFAAHRDEMIVSTKAGYRMWPGPYGEWGSRKSLLASLDQSLKRLKLDYVDVFYHHRPDPDTPLEESMSALADAVRSGRALYVAVSNYSAEQTREAARALRQLGTPLLLHQPNYSMLNRAIERELLGVLAEEGAGCIPFSVLAQGVLTNRYLDGVPPDSRARHPANYFKQDRLNPATLEKVRALNAFAVARGSTLAQLAINWVLRRPEVTTVLVGASRPAQIEDIAQSTSTAPLLGEELAFIDRILLG